MREKDEWVQDCVLCEGTGIDEANSYPAEGPSWNSMGDPGHLEPCICQYDLTCGCGYGVGLGPICVTWCGNGHYDGACPPLYAELRLDDQSSS